MGLFAGDLNRELFKNSGNDIFALVFRTEVLGVLGGKRGQLMRLLSLRVLFNESVFLSTGAFRIHNYPSQKSPRHP